MAQPKILLFIPAYNCRTQIQRVIATLPANLPAAVSEIIVVENRSTDDTVAQIERSFGQFHTKLPTLRLLQNQENYGLGGSHKVAYRYALDHNFDGVITLHGDDQANLADFVGIINKWAGNELEVEAILGSRFSIGSRLEGYSLARILGNYTINFVWSLILLRPIPDLGSGLNFVSTSAIRRMNLHCLPDSLLFNSQQLLTLLRVNARVVFHPISWRESDQKSNAIPWKVFLGEVYQVLRYRFNPSFLTSNKQQNRDYTYRVLKEFAREAQSNPASID